MRRSLRNRPRGFDTGPTTLCTVTSPEPATEALEAPRDALEPNIVSGPGDSAAVIAETSPPWTTTFPDPETWVSSGAIDRGHADRSPDPVTR